MKTRPNEDPAATHFAWMRMAFAAIQSGDESMALVPCRVNGYPSAAICSGRLVGNNRAEVMPLFVAYTDGITIDFQPGEGEEGGGGPRQPAASVREAFRVTLASVTEAARYG